MKKAFTLIELLVAIAIICILAAMLVPIIHKVMTHRSNGTTQTSVSSDPRQSPIAPPKQPDMVHYIPGAFTLQINDPAMAEQVVKLLKANGYKVEPVTDKASLVFKGQ
jgi:prepilin-type N-terminal cleavage/methylation domain-containing protein